MKILNKLTLKHLELNKKRTIVTIIGIILSCALMVGIGLLFSSMQDYSIKEVKDYNGSYQLRLDDVTLSDYNKIKGDKNTTYFYEQAVGFSKIDSDNSSKPYLYIANVNKNYFKELKLIKGRFPINDNEIVLSKTYLDSISEEYNIGDIIKLDIGNRVVDNKVLSNSKYKDDEELVNMKPMEYKIVGIVKKSVYEDYEDAGFYAFTTNGVSDNNIKLYVSFNDNKDIIKKSEALADSISYDKKKIVYNDSLLMLYGESRYGNISTSIVSAMAIMLTLISIGCIMVIYNSFAISVMERKKEFGLFASVGTTKWQILHTTLFEALIVGIIGIVLGILSSLLGIKVVLEITNYLLKDVFEYRLELVIIPLYIIIPVIFMIIVIFISSIIPGIRASRVSPIEAIRQNDDIKIKAKKLKTNKLVKRVFGVEGEIALKSIKRNKKKYRITVISLFISIVLFITFSTYLGYTVDASKNLLQVHDYDVMFNIYDNKLMDDSRVKALVNSNDIDKKMSYQTINIPILNDKDNYTSTYLDTQKDRLAETYNDYMNKMYTDITVIGLDNASYKDYLKELGLNEDKIIVLNNYKTISYKDNGRKIIETNVYKDNFKIKACNFSSYVDRLDDITADVINNSCNNNINNIYVTNKAYFGLDIIAQAEGIKLVVSEDMFKYLYNNYHVKYDSKESIDKLGINYVIKAKDTSSLDKLGEALVKDSEKLIYLNLTKEMQLQKNIILVIKILMYGFISLVALIGVTSVFNTINTSMALRRREFAVLRSVGLTRKGFNKILYFESIFLGMKSLLYSIPASFLVIYLIHTSMSGIQTTSVYIPYSSYLIAIIGVFIIVLVTMMYSSSKIKRDNILEQIRQENI